MMRGYLVPMAVASLWLSSRAAQLPDLSSLAPGETVRLTAGRYEEPIVLERLAGTKEKPIRIVAEPGVVFDGTRPVTTRWEPWRDGIWRTRIEFDVWQLFIGGKLAYVARWPDASFEDGSIWRMRRCMRNTDHGWDRKERKPTGKTSPGVVFDAPWPSVREGDFREGDGGTGAAHAQRSLAASAKDFTGALVVLNSGHWLTWTRPIRDHEKGASRFTYDDLAGTLKGASAIRFNKNVAYYILGLPALDRPSEWWFDVETKTVYVMPPAGRDPNVLDVRGKVRDHGIVLKGCSDLEFRGVRVFGQGFRVDGCNRIRFQDCRFDYPATHRFLLHEFGTTTPWTTGHASAVSRKTSRDVTFVNCRFAYSNAALYLAGERTVVENCLFHDIEWDVNSSGGCGTIVTGPSSVVRRCTVMRTGNSEGIRVSGTGNTVALNHVWDMGNLQYDGAAINVGTRDQHGCLVEGNWAHHCNRQGIRFDYHGTGLLREDGRIHGDGVYFRNVTWNTQPNQVKGDRHLILNNTIVSVNRYPDPGKEKMNMAVQGFKCMHEIEGNRSSLTRNNIANLAHRSWNLADFGYSDGWRSRTDGYRQPGAYVLPGVCDHNAREPGAAYKHLRDPSNLDFRPRPDSPLVDAGKTVALDEVKSPVARFEGIDYVGRAPDVGAYEHGDKRYCIPGFQHPHASTPVPPDRALGVKPDADLMFLEAYQCVRHRVWFGLEPDALALIAELEDSATNIVTPPELKPDVTYYWQIDALSDGKITKSPVWSFTVAK